MPSQNTSSIHRQGHIYALRSSAGTAKHRFRFVAPSLWAEVVGKKWTSGSVCQPIATVPYRGVLTSKASLMWFLFILLWRERGKGFWFPIGRCFWDFFVICDWMKCWCNNLSIRLRSFDSKGCRNTRLDGQVCAVPLIQRSSFGVQSRMWPFIIRCWGKPCSKSCKR